MKIIQYQIMVKVNHGTEAEPDIVQTFYPCKIRCCDSDLEANLTLAKAEAYGEVTVDDDGQSDPAEVPTQLDRIEAQVTYTAMMTDTLLEV